RPRVSRDRRCREAPPPAPPAPRCPTPTGPPPPSPAHACSRPHPTDAPRPPNVARATEKPAAAHPEDDAVHAAAGRRRGRRCGFRTREVAQARARASAQGGELCLGRAADLGHDPQAVSALDPVRTWKIARQVPTGFGFL